MSFEVIIDDAQHMKDDHNIGSGELKLLHTQRADIYMHVDITTVFVTR